MMQLFGLTILVIFGVVTSQNHDVNLQTRYRGLTRRRSVEVTTAFPPDPTVEDDGMRFLLTRLETLCVEKLEYLITDTNRRFLSLESQSSEVHSTVNNIRDEIGRINYPLTRLENLFVNKLDNLTTEVGRMSQCCSVPVTPVVKNSEILEIKVEDSSKNIEELTDTTTNLPSEMEPIKPNVSSLINVTSSLVNLSSNSELKPILEKDLQTATSKSCQLNSDTQYPRNCRQVLESQKTASGTYMIQPEHAQKPFEVVCDLETRGGGWTVIQKRFDGSQDFFLDWQNYKNGFGNLAGEFWLGLEHIHLLTGFEVNELLIEVGDFESQNKSALYSEFKVGSEMEEYALKNVGAYSGDSGDSFSGHAGMKFTTKDKDQDDYPTNCADRHGGAWWYQHCAHSNLNGKYFVPGQVGLLDEYDEYNADNEDNKDLLFAVYWFEFKKDFSSLKQTRMLVRPKEDCK